MNEGRNGGRKEGRERERRRGRDRYKNICIEIVQSEKKKCPSCFQNFCVIKREKKKRERWRDR